MLIDKQTQEQLRAKYNPDGSKIREMQMAMKNILDVVDEVCVKNDIPYWLCSGTLIGAVRHGGFIPWDDDLDIDMLRSDIPRFIEACKRDLPEGYVIQNHSTDKNYYLNIVKVRQLGTEVREALTFKDGTDTAASYNYKGYFIDIIPIEPSKYRLVKLAGKSNALLISAIFHWHLPKFIIELIYRVNLLIYSLFRFISMLVADKNKCYVTYGSWFYKPRYLNDIFPLQRIEFEGSMYNAPKDTHAYLSKIYKDYTKLPEDALRVPMHDTNLNNAQE